MAAFEPLPTIFPEHMAPIITQSTDGERELIMRSWGFILLRDGYPQNQDRGYSVQGRSAPSHTLQWHSLSAAFIALAVNLGAYANEIIRARDCAANPDRGRLFAWVLGNASLGRRSIEGGMHDVARVPM